MRTLLVLVALLAAACASKPSAAGATERGLAELIGSTRHARVAIERKPDAGELVYLARSLDPARIEELRRVAPRVRVVTGLSNDEALARAGEAHGADATYASTAFLGAATNLVWIQAYSAGVDRWSSLAELFDARSVVLTNMRGVHGPVIADHVFALLLALTRDLPVHVTGRMSGTWNRAGSGVLTPVGLESRTLLVVGLGGIGTEIARRGHGFGMRVIATRRGDDPGPAYVERVGKPADLLSMLPEADVVALAVPLTAETERMIDARAFAAMKRGTYLVNIARGKVVDQDALVAALRDGTLAGAGLDVTDPEPLPAAHPLWTFPNVLITPHMAADGALTEERARALLVENFRRFDAGEPLLNVVDLAAGY
jgi:phosphoglycerate dehydrogenase-like enzyme